MDSKLTSTRAFLWSAFLLLAAFSVMPTAQATGVNSASECKLPVPDVTGIICEIWELYCGWGGGGLLEGISPVDVDPVKRGVAVANNPTAIPGQYSGYNGVALICQ